MSDFRCTLPSSEMLNQSAEAGMRNAAYIRTVTGVLRSFSRAKEKSLSRLGSTCILCCCRGYRDIMPAEHSNLQLDVLINALTSLVAILGAVNTGPRSRGFTRDLTKSQPSRALRVDSSSLLQHCFTEHPHIRTMGGSQLTQLKAALSSAGLGRKTHSKKEKKEWKKGGAREVDRVKQAAKLDEIRRGLNKFDVRETKASSLLLNSVARSAPLR